MKHLLAVNGMGNFGMKLNTIEISTSIAHCSARTFFCARNRCKTFRQSFYIVGMTHPTNTFLWNPFEQNIICGKHSGFSVFAAILCRGYFTTGHVCHQLISVADAENRDSQIQDCSIIMWRSLLINAIWSSCKNHSFVTVFLYFFN